MSLPYQDKPATMQDVITELATFAGVIAAGIAHGGPTAPQRLEDPTTELGKMLVVRKARLGLALMSWVQGEVDGALQAVAEAVKAATEETHP